MLELFKNGEPLADGQQFDIVYDKIVKFRELCEFTPEKVTEYCDWTAQNYIPARITAVCGDADDSCALLLESRAETRRIPFEGGKAEFTNLYPGADYTAVVTDAAGKILTEVRRFSTSPVQQRTLYIDGVDNTRDIGGNVTPYGRVKYGIIYRGSTPRTLTEQGLKTFIDELGIRTELDVTGGCENTEALEARIRCVYHSLKWYSLIFEEEGQPALRDAVKVFTDPDAFPVYYHCSLGRDRTGTLTFILNALCGCTKEQLFREQFMSMFSLRGDGEHAGIEAHIANIQNLYNGMMAQLGEDHSIFENTRAFMNKIGVTDEDIAKIRANLLEKV